MKRIENPNLEYYQIRERDMAKITAETPEAINQHAEAIDKLIKENKELKEKLATLEKIIEVLAQEIKELKKSQLIAVIEQAPPAYSNK